ncbi:proline-rich domain-containing protein [Promineifilum sp.]|uniref:proline-rich domain-containing protein n=1 Tax=Promineifilum sp. TaxID=2664178 RepID=UPI0035B239A1
MQQERLFNRSAKAVPEEVQFKSASRKTVIGIILVVALIAFEIFNFDTTRFALNSLLGEVAFMGMTWATILATAFCAIDFAGLARLFTPERGAEEPKAVWYLMGAWLLGATMNAVMTWWAVSLTLISHDFGNEVLARETLLKLVPIFVAALVLLTRILFIGAFSVAGEHVFDLAGNAKTDKQPAARPQPALPTHPPLRATTARASQPVPVETDEPKLPTTNRPPAGGRTYQRPPTPSGVHQMPAPMQAKSRDR